MKMKVYYMLDRTEIKHDDYDEDIDDYRPRNYNTKTIEIKEFNSNEIDKAFSLEDGDGDDCGSYSYGIFLITDNKNKVLWDSSKYLELPKNLWGKYEEHKKRCIENIKNLEV